MPRLILAALFSCLSMSVQAQTSERPEPPPGFSDLPRHIVKRIEQSFPDMGKIYQQLDIDVRSFGTDCSPLIVRTDGQNRLCAQRQVIIEQNWQLYSDSLEKMKLLVAEASKQFPQLHYAPIGRAFIGGLTATGGFYANAAMDAAHQTEARSTYRQHLLKTGTPPDGLLDLDKYEFAFGLAISPDISAMDLTELLRAIADDTLEGVWSQKTRKNYPSLIGRDFDTLTCHSNGAMICIAALRNGDIAARSVTLWGPQITADSLAGWQTLVTQGWVESVQMKWTDRDIVPIVSYDLGKYELGKFVAGAQVMPDRNLVEFAIRIKAPSIQLESGRCPDRTTPWTSVPCHEAAIYQRLFTDTQH
jgi:hypothetical protein